MKKIIVILCVLLLSMSAIHAVDHYLGPVLDTEIGGFELYINGGINYKIQMNDYFGIVQFLTIGFSVPQFAPAFNVKYMIYPSFTIGQRRCKFTVSALGFHIANDFYQDYKGNVYRIYFGPAQQIGFEIHPNKAKYFIFRFDAIAQSFMQIYIGNKGFDHAMAWFPVGGFIVSCIFRLNNNRKK